MANDVEMNDVQKPLMKDSDIENIPDVEFKSIKQDTEIVKRNDEFRGLTKEELEKFAKDPFWKKLRLILFILFWIVWAAMLVAAILIVVFSKKCPTRPKLEFWQRKTGYWVDPYAYADTDQNLFGDFKGIMTKLDHIQKQVGAGYIILNPIFKGQLNDQNQKNEFIDSFRNVDPKLGSIESFKELVKNSRKRGIEIVLSVDLNSLSTSSKNMADLNLKSNSVLTEIKESIKIWLNHGVMGFLLTNLGMYAENSTNTANLTPYSCVNDPAHKPYFSNQFSTIDVQMFLKEIRKTMDEVAKNTDKSRLLIVDAGDIGLAVGRDDPLLQYLGKKENLADMIISREFLKYRGWGRNCDGNQSSISNYLSKIPSDKRKMIGLTSTTLFSPRTDELMKTVSPFLLEGNSILYYGSEVSLSCDKINLSNSNLYPANSNSSNKCNHLIMPWDNTGDEFSNGKMNESQYLSQYKDTVQSLTAAGTGENSLKLHAKLIKIRNEPSLLWGATKLIKSQRTSTYSHDVFTRQADGFPIIVVAILTDSSPGKVFSFKSICEKFTPILVYPSNGNLEENKEIDTKNIFLKSGETGSVHVFKCAE